MIPPTRDIDAGWSRSSVRKLVRRESLAFLLRAAVARVSFDGSNSTEFAIDPL
jgi:hypothetical protein